jgi:hypothetical protein
MQTTNRTDNEAQPASQEEHDQISKTEFRRRANVSRRMNECWNNPEWATRVRKNMKAARQTTKLKNKMREAQLQAARQRASETGVVPHWAPKQVSVLEATGTWHTYESVRQAAKHYGMTESNIRAVIKYGRTYNGMKFIVAEAK